MTSGEKETTWLPPFLSVFTCSVSYYLGQGTWEVLLVVDAEVCSGRRE